MNGTWIQQNRYSLWGRSYDRKHNRRFRENIWKKQDLLFHLWNNYQEPEDFSEAWKHVAAFQRKLIKDREDFPERKPPEYFLLYTNMSQRFVELEQGAKWALNWKVEESENEKAGYNIPVKYNNCIKKGDFKNLVCIMDDIFLTLVKILKNKQHLSKLQMLELFKLVLDDRYDCDDVILLDLRGYLHTHFNFFSTKDDDEESRDIVFRMMVDIVTIQKLDRNTEQQQMLFIERHGSSLMTTERIKDRLIEIKELLKTFDGAIYAERTLSKKEGRPFDHNRLSFRLFSIVKILIDLEQTKVAEQYIEKHGPIIDTWTRSKIVKITMEIVEIVNQEVYLTRVTNGQGKLSSSGSALNSSDQL